jgi:hypothetical protein
VEVGVLGQTLSIKLAVWSIYSKYTALREHWESVQNRRKPKDLGNYLKKKLMQLR